jgi:hypothetical protein
VGSGAGGSRAAAGGDRPAEHDLAAADLRPQLAGELSVAQGAVDRERHALAAVAVVRDTVYLRPKASTNSASPSGLTSRACR